LEQSVAGKQKSNEQSKQIEIEGTLPLPTTIYTKFPKCMVRRATAREKRRGDRQVCANVFGLWWRAESPGHDELRCVLFLINGTVIEDHFREQVASTPLGGVRSS
jgi:hypothetical protein